MNTSTELGRILAIDYGDKRIGLAVSDPMQQFAFGLSTIHVRRPSDVPNQIIQALDGREIALILMGLPLNMDGTEGPRAQITRAFGEDLANQLKLPIQYVDERLTSMEAEDRLSAQGIQPSRNKGAVDQAAAQLILEQYLANR
ncbi:MAG: Holliday junction resolvase RuvX [Vampirovibrio sp.]|nr:Holliday junction resolvase RuvX [Vampirovibrio sp.]